MAKCRFLSNRDKLKRRVRPYVPPSRKRKKHRRGFVSVWFSSPQLYLANDTENALFGLPERAARLVKTKKRLNGRDVPGRHRLAVPSPGRDPRTHRTCVAALLLVSSIDVTDLSMSCTVCPCNEGPDLRSVRFVRSLAVTPVPGAVVLLHGLEPDFGPLLTVRSTDLAGCPSAWLSG